MQVHVTAKTPTAKPPKTMQTGTPTGTRPAHDPDTNEAHADTNTTGHLPGHRPKATHCCSSWLRSVIQCPSSFGESTILGRAGGPLMRMGRGRRCVEK